eukprot:1946541-Amphidinium_carterae.1
MKTYGSAQFYRGLWCELTSQHAETHMRTDANNLVTTASTTHLPEEKETIHIIQMLRQEACSGAMDDLAHVVTQKMMADLLTKSSAPSDPLIHAVSSGTVPGADTNPPFRSTIRHHAFSSVYNPQEAPTINCWTHSASGPVCIKVSLDTDLVVPSERNCPVLDSVMTGQRVTLMTDSGTKVLEDTFRKDGRKKVQEHTSWTLLLDIQTQGSTNASSCEVKSGIIFAGSHTPCVFDWIGQHYLDGSRGKHLQ